MAWFNRLGIWTWRTSPTKERISEVMKMPLWARITGRARRSHDERPVGVDGGPGRLVAGLLGDRDERGARFRRCPVAAAGGSGSSSGRPSGQPVGDEGLPPGHQAVEGPLGLGRRRRGSRRCRPAGRRRRRRRCRARAGPLSVRTWSTRRRSATDVAALDQPPGHQAVDHGGDAGRPDGQALGQVRGDGGALVEEAQHPVLGQGQVDRGQAELDLLGQPGRGPADGLALSRPGAPGPLSLKLT